ncbi:MAG TPA: dolichyl-phosphate beta-glucosyltransferase [Candidatus Sulfomarinibacteraceae bacterium]|nr:dolichyl-phosphate beta-glucosyltransferase [Candidatus Sulfomarinibacteraceae bacterium]
MNEKTPLLSIIVPAYNEGQRLPTTLPQIAEFVLAQPYQAEVLVVNNNSSDNTRAIALEFAEEFPFIQVLDEPTQGKGAAVRTGMRAACGDYLFMADADLSMPIEEVNKFLPPALNGYDVAIGSREVDGSVRYNEPEYRHLMGRVFNFIVRLLAVPGFHDTQAGFKCFRRPVAMDLLASQSINGWAFDVELLYIALQRHYRVVEVPIHWHYRQNSRISPVKDAIDMVREVLRIRINGWRGRYDTNSQVQIAEHS